MALTAVIYGVMGLRFGGDAFDGSVVDEVVSAISSEFHVGVIAFIPVVLLLTLIFLKKPAMLSTAVPMVPQEVPQATETTQHRRKVAARKILGLTIFMP